MDVQEKVCQLIGARLKVYDPADATVVTPECQMADFGDSLAKVEMLVDIEAEYDLEYIKQEALNKMKSVQDVIDYVRGKIAVQSTETVQP
jgi:acyl carrier protein